MIWLTVAALMVLVALVHAMLGERRLIGPRLRARDGVMASDLARRVTRMAWHLTSLPMVLCAAVVAWPGVPRALVAVVGAGWLAAGLGDALYTRGRHIGWSFLVLAGAAALAGASG